MSPAPARSFPEALHTVVRALLALSDRSWSTITGTLTTWRDEKLLDVGRSRSACDPAAPSLVAQGASPRRYETEHRFWAMREPWRIRMELVRMTLPDEEYAFSTMIVHGQIWWVEDTRSHGLTVLSNHGQDNRTGTACQGTFDLDKLLQPAGLAGALVPSQIAAIEVGGRNAITVRGTPLESPGDAFWLMGGLTTLGATEYQFSVDAAVGILLRAEAFVDGQLARREELTQVTADQPLDPALFVPRW